MRIQLITFAKIDPNFLDSLAEGIETVLNDISDQLFFSCGTQYKKNPLPKLSYDISKKQYNAELILENLGYYRTNNDIILGILDVDVSSDPHIFLFGKADIQKKVAIISLYRLISKFDNEPYKVIERATKEAVHEIGHIFNLDHCQNKQCVMVSSETVLNIDRKSMLFCPNCIQKLVGHKPYPF